MRQVAWKTAQFCVFAAVIFSNIRYEWTPNGYAASIVAFVAVLLVSAIPIMASDLAALLRRAGSALGLVRLSVHGEKQAVPPAPHLGRDFEVRPAERELAKPRLFPDFREQAQIDFEPSPTNRGPR